MAPASSPSSLSKLALTSALLTRAKGGIATKVLHTPRELLLSCCQRSRASLNDNPPLRRANIPKRAKTVALHSLLFIYGVKSSGLTKSLSSVRPDIIAIYD